MVATVVSFLAVAISLVALGLQLVRTFWERPYVFVGGIAGSHSVSVTAPPVWECRIDVTNVGERAVTLIEVGLVVDRKPGSNVSWGLTGDEVADFPMRLEPHDSRSWLITGDGPIPAAIGSFVPWVKIVQRPNWLQRRHETLPERTIQGRLFGSVGPELDGPKVGKPSRRQRRVAEARRQAERAARFGNPIL